MALTPGDSRTRGFVKYTVSDESIADTGPCRLMAAVLTGPTADWEGIILEEAATVSSGDIVLKALVGKSMAWSFGPCGIRFSTLSASITGSGTPGGVAYVFLILE